MPINEAQIRKECIYRTNGPGPSLLGELIELESLAKSEKAVRAKLRWVSLAILIAGVLLAFVWGPLLILGLLAALGLFIYSFLHGQALVAHPTRQQFQKDLLTVLEPDMSAKSPLTVVLHLKKRETKLSEKPWPQRKKGKESFHMDEWLEVSGRFLDGTEFSETVTDLIRTRSYLNASNKNKVKTRRHTLIALKLRYPSAVYGDAGRAYQTLGNTLQASQTVQLKGFEVTEKAVSLKGVISDDKHLKEASAILFLGAYRILNLSRKLTASGGAK